MPIKKWIKQFCILFVLLAPVLGGIQVLKGRTVDYGISFGLTWGLISALIVLASRFYYYRKNIYCAVCNDLPNPDDKVDNS